MIQVDDGAGIYWSGPFEDRQVDGVIADYNSFGYTVVDIDYMAKPE